MKKLANYLTLAAIVIVLLFQSKSVHAQAVKNSDKKESACPYVVLNKRSGQPELRVPKLPSGITFYTNGDLGYPLDGKIYYCIEYNNHNTVWMQKDVRCAARLIHTDPEKNTASTKSIYTERIIAKN